MQDAKLGLALSLALILLIGAYAAGLTAARDKILGGGADFVAFYSAAKIVYSGEGESLYRPEVQRQAQAGLRNVPLPYNHPPFEVLLFLPLALLPFDLAYAAFVLANAALLVAVARLRDPTDPSGRLVWLTQAVTCLAFYPVFLTVAHGQDSILLLLLFGLAFVALKRGKDLQGGLWLGIALFKFQIALPFLFTLGWARRWKVLQGALAVAVVLGLVSLLLVGWQGVMEYPGFLLDLNRNPASARIAMMPNVRGLLSALLPEGSARAGTALTAMLSMLLLIAGGRQWPQHAGTTEELDLAFSANVVLCLLVSYHLNAHDVSLMLIPVALIVRHLRRTRLDTEGGRARRVAMAGLTAALFYAPFLVPSRILPPAPIFWVMLLLAVGIGFELKSRREPVAA